MITLKIPIPPSVNAAYRVVNNRPILSREARAYRKHIQQEWPATGQAFGNQKIAIVIYVTLGNKIRRDLDNLCKVSLDALQHAGWYDSDWCIDDLHIIRLKPQKDNPHLLITISEIDEELDAYQLMGGSS